MLIAVCLSSGRAGASAAITLPSAVGRRSHPSIVPRAPDEVYSDSRYSGISATGGTHLATSVYLRYTVQEGIETSPVLKVKVWGILVYQSISIRCTPVLCASWAVAPAEGESFEEEGGPEGEDAMSPARKERREAGGELPREASTPSK